MNALYLTLFVSLGLVAGAILLFATGWQRKDHDHADRLSLLPLDDDTAAPARPSPCRTTP